MRKVILVTAVLTSIALYPAAIRISGQEPAQPQEVSAVLAEGGDLWFVELTSPPTADGTSAAQVRNEKAAFRRAAAQAGVNFEERRAFDTLWNGLSVRINPTEIGKLSRVEGVTAIYPIVAVRIPETQPSASPELISALSMTGADVAQAELGLTGHGVKVAVMDTGVDFDHPALGGCFGSNCRVNAGFDFVGDAYNNDVTSPTFNPVPRPDNIPDDCNGHGTHVAGIIGADGGTGGVRGVAPAVTIGAYRVFGCNGSTSSDIMIAAMERALADGMDVLNMSIGSSFQWPQYPTAQASDRLVNKGMVVVAAAGNSGGNGLYSLSAPSVGKKVISVASFNNTEIRLPFFTVSPDDLQIGYNRAAAAPAAPTAGTFSLVRTGTATSAADGCAALAPGSLAGKVALIRRGTCTFNVKSVNAQNAGAVGVVIYNNAPGVQSITVAGPPAVTIPVVSISKFQGEALDNLLAAGAVTGTWTAQLAQFPNAVGNLISDFSSYGLSPDLTLKPDLGAPGGSIFSTIPLESGGFASFSGTSMSSPHVAGAVALLLEARPHMSPQAVRGILQNSADPKPWFGNPALGFLDNAHRQGAGMLDIEGAIVSTTRVEPSKLSLGESEAGPVTQTLTVTNDGPADVTYTLSHAPALSTGANTFTPAFFTGFASVTFSAPSVTVPAGGSATVDVTITANAALADRSMYSGYIVLTSTGGAVSRVPYAGFKGDYQSITVLAPTANGFPWLAKLVGSSFLKQSLGATYTLQGNDVPFFLVHLDHQSRRLRMTVNEVATGKSWHRVFDEEYVGRTSTATGFFALSWDGTTQGGKQQYTVPNGQYQITLTVTKALGDDSNPAHVESWASPVITIARPASTTP